MKAKNKKPIAIVVAITMLMSVFIGTTFFIENAKATFVEGEINTNKTWTLANSPYVVSNIITIKSTATLTIEPGVIVKFGGNFKIIVEGNLSAIGTVNNKITFTSNQANPSVGYWNTIEFVGGIYQSFKIKYCIVEYGKIGLSVNSKGSSLIEYSEFRNNDNGIRIQDNGNSHITNSEIHNNTIGVYIHGEVNLLVKDNNISWNYYGISSDGSTVSGIEIESNEIKENEEDGIYLYSDGYDQDSYIHNITITTNTISSNQANGIYLYSYNNYDNAYIYNITITSNTISSNQGNGIYLYSYSNSSHIYNITITTNTISSNQANGIYLYSYSDSSYIYNITIISNTISSNQGNGIYLYSYSYDYDSYIYNITITTNTISSNQANGIYLYSYNNYDNAYIYNITITSNTISSSKDAGIKIKGENHESTLQFDLIFNQNKLYSNFQGILIEGGIIANLTQNSIAYNTNEGILFDTSQNNEAHYNDIYGNGNGMYVSNSARVSADNNYWGDSSGPYQEGLNPTGKGNAVNGDGTDLDFIPFLNSPVGSISQRPMAKINADKTSAGINENITFDGGQSTDDGEVVDYYFDYGDENNTGWTTISVVKHKYSSDGNYIVSLKVRDDNGIESNNTAEITVNVKNHIPNATIDGISPNPANYGELINFIGHGNDSDGNIIAYEWHSSIDGYMGNTTSFSYFLSGGNHNISFRVKDNYNVWSDYVYETLIVNSFPSVVSLSSGEITKNSIKLTWDKNKDNDFKNYTLFISEDNKTWVFLTSISDRNIIFYNAINLNENTTHYFKIRVYDFGNLYNESSVIKVETLKQQTPPSEIVEEKKEIPILYIGIAITLIIVINIILFFFIKRRPKQPITPTKSIR